MINVIEFSCRCYIEQIDWGKKKSEFTLLCLVFSAAPANQCVSTIIFPIMVCKSISIETRFLPWRLLGQIWHKANHNCRLWMVTALALCVIFLEKLCLCMLSEVRMWLFNWRKRHVLIFNNVPLCNVFYTAGRSMHASTKSKTHLVLNTFLLC